jgi:hypothetical protein
MTSVVVFARVDPHKIEKDGRHRATGTGAWRRRATIRGETLVTIGLFLSTAAT